MSGKSPKRPATEDDVKAGKAIFYVPDGRSQVHDIGCELPLKAILKEALDVGDSGKLFPKGTRVEVVQVEILDGTHVVAGFRVGTEEGVCTLEELEILSGE